MKYNGIAVPRKNDHIIAELAAEKINEVWRERGINAGARTTSSGAIESDLTPEHYFSLRNPNDRAAQKAGK